MIGDCSDVGAFDRVSPFRISKSEYFFSFHKGNSVYHGVTVFLCELESGLAMSEFFADCSSVEVDVAMAASDVSARCPSGRLDGEEVGIQGFDV